MSMQDGTYRRSHSKPTEWSQHYSIVCMGELVKEITTFKGPNG